MQNSKSQISAEFIIIFAILAAVFLLFMEFGGRKNIEAYGNQNFLDAKQIADKSANNINNVFFAGDGATTSFYLPETLASGIPYSVVLIPSAHLVEVSWNARSYTSPIVTAEMAGLLSPSPGLISLANNNGLVYVSQAGAPYCGDASCSAGENCETCPADCPTNAGTVCCSGVIFTGDCCSNADCAPAEECINYMCTLTVITCQQACSALGFGQWQCRASCAGAWKNPAPAGNAYCSPNVCCCK